MELDVAATSLCTPTQGVWQCQLAECLVIVTLCVCVCVTLKRAVIFCLVVFGSLAVGCFLGGELYRPTSGQPLMTLAGYACMGMGIVYFVLQYAVEYQADVAGAGFEYGKAFILTAGLMNILLVLDAVDIGRGQKR